MKTAAILICAPRIGTIRRKDGMDRTTRYSIVCREGEKGNAVKISVCFHRAETV